MGVLADFRTRAGMTQLEASNRTGLQPTQISRLERGASAPLRMTLQTAITLADAYGVPVGELIEALKEEQR